MIEEVKVSAIDTAIGHRLASVKEACRYGKRFAHEML